METGGGVWGTDRRQSCGPLAQFLLFPPPAQPLRVVSIRLHGRLVRWYARCFAGPPFTSLSLSGGDFCSAAVTSPAGTSSFPPPQTLLCLLPTTAVSRQQIDHDGMEPERGWGGPSLLPPPPPLRRAVNVFKRGWNKAWVIFRFPGPDMARVGQCDTNLC